MIRLINVAIVIAACKSAGRLREEQQEDVCAAVVACNAQAPFAPVGRPAECEAWINGWTDAGWADADWLECTTSFMDDSGYCSTSASGQPRCDCSALLDAIVYCPESWR